MMTNLPVGTQIRITNKKSYPGRIGEIVAAGTFEKIGGRIITGYQVDAGLAGLLVMTEFDFEVVGQEKRNIAAKPKPQPEMKKVYVDPTDEELAKVHADREMVLKMMGF